MGDLGGNELAEPADQLRRERLWTGYALALAQEIERRSEIRLSQRGHRLRRYDDPRIDTTLTKWDRGWSLDSLVTPSRKAVG
jgi:hypothetical protein